MASREEANQPGDPSNPHRLARLLRHEVGDLLQSVYSTVGVLLERLPAELKLERRLLSDMKSRAELCKVELDAVVDLVSPVRPTSGRTDFLTTVHAALIQGRQRFPALPVHFEAQAAGTVEADPRALSSSLGLLFLAFCQGAQQKVWVRVGRQDAQAECVLERDGYAVPPEQLAWLAEWFATTQNALFGLGLALVQRVVQASGGAVTAGNRPEGGVSVRIVLPSVNP
jgi:signal transduction histidine kinase